MAAKSKSLLTEPGGYGQSRGELSVRAAEAGQQAWRLEQFEVEVPRRKLADLVVDEKTLVQVRALLSKIRHHKVLYEDFGLAEIDPGGGRMAINLYGPSGTGKSFTAEAIAHELGRGLIRANYAEIESKFVGETPKNIKAVFEKARQTGALLFFDEADSILGKRLSNVSQSSDHAVNVSRSVMLLELDSFQGVTVFATNLMGNYDPAFARRILGHVEMSLPDAAARRRLWQAHMPAGLPVQLSEGDWRKLVRVSAGLAGGDVLNAVLYAAATAIERDGPGCRITIVDLLHAVEAGQKGKAAIGVA